MFSDHDGPLPFSLNMAEKLMAIAKRLKDVKSATWQSLPASWPSLYELSQVPMKKITALVKRGDLHAALTVREVRRLAAVEKPSKPQTLRVRVQGGGVRTSSTSIRIAESPPTPVPSPVAPQRTPVPPPPGYETHDTAVEALSGWIDRLISYQKYAKDGDVFFTEERIARLEQCATRLNELLTLVREPAEERT